MGKPSAPPPPDFRGAAIEQGEANLEAARATGRMNNPNVYNPYGTQIITWQGDQPTVRQEFSPEQQALFEQSNRVKGLLGGLGEQGAGALYDILGRNLDLGGLPAQPGDAQATRDQVINAMMSRVDTDLGQQREQRTADLVAAGIRPGTEAYDREMTRLDRSRTDALQQAQLAAGAEAQRDFGMDMDRRRAALSELLASRQTPLNEITALMSGSQVNNPFAGNLGYQAGANVQPAPLFNAAQSQWGADMDIYNSQAGMFGNTMSGLFGLGSAWIGR